MGTFGAHGIIASQTCTYICFTRKKLTTHMRNSKTPNDKRYNNKNRRTLLQLLNSTHVVCKKGSWVHDIFSFSGFCWPFGFS